MIDMNQKSFSTIVGVVFSLIAILHLLRAVYGWEAVIGGWAMPLWASWVALVAALYFAYTSFRLAKKS